ncbi:ankyrin repeat domain-containing protein [Flavimarina sp. Hel_I_48]|uniref:ankyrin repeat domain-containing protein n=1 Tax=Flavimarina sp. Hel_I_48 TaxID=1392488 RepID=UPI0004DF6692|nr:ankyrin repeat domain-containing protein [Flavimarina sp. Hel_I_48]
MKKALILLILLTISTAFSQEENILLERSFWEKNPDLTIVKEQIAAGNDPAQFASNAFDPAVLATLGGASSDVISYLLSFEGNDVNKKTHDSRTYIFWAAYANRPEIMKQLLEKGAKLDVTDSHGYTPVAFAANGGQTNPEIYDLFEEYGVVLANEKTDHGANLLLLLSPNMETAKDMDYFITKGINPKEKDDSGNGIFNYAARKGNISFLQSLVDRDYDYKTLNKEGENAFLFAAQGSRGHTNSLDLFEYLNALGLDPAVVTKKGETALHSLAYRSKDMDVLNFFLEKGLDVDQANAEGNTPLLNAASRNKLDIVNFLYTHSKNPEATNEQAQTPLMLALQNNSPEVVDFFLEKQKKPNDQKDNNNNSLAYYLVDGYSPRNKDAFNAKLDLLKKHKIALNTVQNEGNTALHIAAKTNNPDLLKEVASWNIPINAINDEGLTALHIAAMKAQNDEVLKYLIAQGADKNVKTSFEESAYDLASENELLKENGVAIKFLN